MILEADLARPDGGPVTEYADDRAAHLGAKALLPPPGRFCAPRHLSRAQRAGAAVDIARCRVPQPVGRPTNHGRGPDIAGEPIANEVVVNIKNVIHARKFDLNAVKPKNLQYIGSSPTTTPPTSGSAGPTGSPEYNRGRVPPNGVVHYSRRGRPANLR